MRGATSWGDGEACPRGGRSLKSGTLAMHCHAAWGQWAVQLLQCTASPHGCSGKWNFCNALPHYLGPWKVQLVQCTVSLPEGSGQWNSCNILPHRLGAVGSGTRCNAVPHCLGAVGSGTPAMRGATN